MKLEISTLLILAFAVCCAGSNAVYRFSTGRIVGGTATSIENYPYQVSLVYYNSHRCGGSIITEHYVLTAAHCVATFSTNTALNHLKIRAGSSYRTSGGTLHAISSFTYHSLYNSTSMDYDIALVKVKLPFEFCSTIQPIGLAPPNYVLPDGTLVSVTGWGYTTAGGSASSVLQVVEVPMINNTYCGELYAYLIEYTEITDRMVCAGYDEGEKDACQGDSGGPMVYGDTQFGIVSWGDECAVASQPGVYASVSNLRNWVIEQTGLDFD